MFSGILVKILSIILAGFSGKPCPCADVAGANTAFPINVALPIALTFGFAALNRFSRYPYVNTDTGNPTQTRVRKSRRSDCTGILVERLWPRGVFGDAAALDHGVKNIAPSPELRKCYGHDP